MIHPFQASKQFDTKNYYDRGLCTQSSKKPLPNNSSQFLIKNTKN